MPALRLPQVWLTLATGAIGFGGLFAVYTYLASTLIEVTGLAPGAVPLVLCVFGIGMTVGNLVVPVFADRALMPTAGGLLLWSAAALALFPLAAGNGWTAAADVFLIFAMGRGAMEGLPDRAARSAVAHRVLALILTGVELPAARG